MSTVSKYIVAFILIVIVSSTAEAQVNVRSTVNRDAILIGEPIQLTVEAYTPLGVDVNWFRTDTIPHFLITGSSSLDTVENIDGKKMIQSFVITSFDSGMQYVPPFEILVNGQAFYTDSIPINVSFMPFVPDADYRDIKDIIEVVNPAAKKIPWYVLALALVSLAALVFFLLRKNVREQVSAAPVIPILSPYEEAMAALRSLQSRDTSNREVKFFYSEMNDILRRYLAREFNIATFERTNEELIMQLSTLQMSKDAFFSLAQALRMSDFVKFAKYKPSEPENERNLQTVKNSIDILNKTVMRAV